MRYPILALALCLAAPADAQHKGSVNRKAPTVTQSLQYPDGPSVGVSYRSITTAEGRFMQAVKDKKKWIVNYVNGTERRPSRALGSFKTSVPLSIGGKTVQAGDYKLYFKLTADMQWQLALGNAKGTVRVPLQAKAPQAKVSRLCITLVPGDKTGTVHMRFAFGDLAASTSAQPVSADEDKPQSRKTK